jgi:hypothetical protein
MRHVKVTGLANLGLHALIVRFRVREVQFVHVVCDLRSLALRVTARAKGDIVGGDLRHGERLLALQIGCENVGEKMLGACDVDETRKWRVVARL